MSSQTSYDGGNEEGGTEHLKGLYETNGRYYEVSKQRQVVQDWIATQDLSCFIARREIQAS